MRSVGGKRGRRRNREKGEKEDRRVGRKMTKGKDVEGRERDEGDGRNESHSVFHVL